MGDIRDRMKGGGAIKKKVENVDKYNHPDGKFVGAIVKESIVM